MPIDTVAVVLLDRGTGWIDVYPTVEAFQHFAGATDKVTNFTVTTHPS